MGMYGGEHNAFGSRGIGDFCKLSAYSGSESAAHRQQIAGNKDGGIAVLILERKYVCLKPAVYRYGKPRIVLSDQSYRQARGYICFCSSGEEPFFIFRSHSETFDLSV